MGIHHRCHVYRIPTILRRCDMNTQEKEYMKLHLLWRSEIKPTEDIQIDESVFEEIYQMQQEAEDEKERLQKRA